MKKVSFIIAINFMLIAFLGCSQRDNHVDMGELKTLKDSASYALGYLNGKQAAQTPQSAVNADLYAKAFKQGYNLDTAGVWTDQKMIEVVNQYLEKTQSEAQKEAYQKAQPDIDRAEKFLSQNQKAQDVKTTNSGLQYKVIKQGKGKKPSVGKGERVIMNYSLSILNDKNEFEMVQSTFNDEGTTPGPIAIDGQCEGIKEALQMMNPGSRYQIWIHPALGYGDSKLMLCEIEVLKIIE